MQKPGKIKSVTIIGAGNVGWHMARAFHQTGIDVLDVVSGTQHHAEELAKMVSATPRTQIDGIAREPDLFLVCVNDDLINEIIGKFSGKETLIAHTSGSTGTEIFQNAVENYGVFYPLQTFTRGNEMTYNTIPFLVEGSSPELVQQLKGLADRISGIVYEADSEARRKMHIAAVFACNFSNHLAAIAHDLLIEAGLKFELLHPLMEETIRKLKTMDPASAQTGPAVRNDIKTIEKHMITLEGRPEEQQLYRLLTESITRYRKKKNE
ncbi:MAG: Rossmann-like and DUF2520 domain-containing protein [Bacteroidales bacterium]